MKISLNRLDSCTSTSAVLAGMCGAEEGTVVYTACQTAGRGQRGNSWEAEPGRNLTFSMLLKPRAIAAARQFEVSMLVALAVARTVSEVLNGCGAPEVSVKWPNDIYVGDRKIAGILIEHSLEGNVIARTIAGIGLNVNQRIFVSDAPNPTSLIHYTGRETDLDMLLHRICGHIAGYFDRYNPDTDNAALLSDYKARLYRGKGIWPFTEADGTHILASITDVAADGMLSLSNGKRYAFKEITFDITDSI